METKIFVEKGGKIFYASVNRLNSFAYTWDDQVNVNMIDF